MKDLLFLNTLIIQQAIRLASLIKVMVSDAIMVKEDYILPNTMVKEIRQMGIDICLINQTNCEHIAESFKFEGYDCECYFDFGDDYLMLGMQLLIAVWDKDNIDLSWFNKINDVIIYPHKGYLYWQSLCVDELLT